MWYNFEGNDSKTVYDLSPRQIDASLKQGERVPGKFSQSLKLAPGASVVISGNDLSFNQSFTLSLWAKILDDAEGTILSNGQARLEYRDDLKLYGSVYTQNGWEEVSTFAQQGKWTHYALALTNSQLMMFINGDQVSSKNLTTAMTWEDLEDRDLYLGSPEAINWSMGGNVLLDELRIYDRALSNACLLYTSPSPRDS